MLRLAQTTVGFTFAGFTILFFVGLGISLLQNGPFPVDSAVQTGLMVSIAVATACGIVGMLSGPGARETLRAAASDFLLASLVLAQGTGILLTSGMLLPWSPMAAGYSLVVVISRLAMFAALWVAVASWRRGMSRIRAALAGEAATIVESAPPPV